MEKILPHKNELYLYDKSCLVPYGSVITANEDN
jgi:hypothetical protein